MNPLLARDYLAFTAHNDERIVRKISSSGLDVATSIKNSLGQSLILIMPPPPL